VPRLRVFDEMPEKNEVSARCPVGRRHDTLDRFLEMRDSTSVPATPMPARPRSPCAPRTPVCSCECSKFTRSASSSASMLHH
jgi:hypothetical protein